MKKLLCILLTLAMVVTTMPIMASAAGTYGGLYIFGTEVTANGTVTGNSTIKSGTVDVQYSSDGK